MRATGVHVEPSEVSERVTSLVVGERVRVVETAGDWRRVVCPEQPSSLDPVGYPGWVPGAALAEDTALAVARGYLGTPYVWGGMDHDGIDCSGLVHMAFRAVGVLVPRDAADQAAAAVPVETPEPGDLWFFGDPVNHVGFVTETGMLHSSGGVGVVEEQMPAERRASLVGAGRLR